MTQSYLTMTQYFVVILSQIVTYVCLNPRTIPTIFLLTILKSQISICKQKNSLLL
jgi:hypothetical protein